MGHVFPSEWKQKVMFFYYLTLSLQHLNNLSAPCFRRWRVDDKRNNKIIFIASVWESKCFPLPEEFSSINKVKIKNPRCHTSEPWEEQEKMKCGVSQEAAAHNHIRSTPGIHFWSFSTRNGQTGFNWGQTASWMAVVGAARPVFLIGKWTRWLLLEFQPVPDTLPFIRCWRSLRQWFGSRRSYKRTEEV